MTIIDATKNFTGINYALDQKTFCGFKTLIAFDKSRQSTYIQP